MYKLIPWRKIRTSVFSLIFLPEIMERYRNLTQSNYLPIPEPVTITSSQQSALFFHYYREYNAEGLRVRFGIRLPNIYVQKFSSKFGNFSEIVLRFNEMERIYQSLTFLVNYVNSFLLTIISHIHLWLLIRITRVIVTFFGHYSILSLPVSNSIVRFSMS